jgi:ATP-dependent protease HslVU (ClpYQ) peptidase subunit
MSFCRSCYFILPAKARKDLYSRVGEGYEQAYAAACAVLDREQEDAAEVATAAPDIGGPKEKPHAR